MISIIQSFIFRLPSLLPAHKPAGGRLVFALAFAAAACTAEPSLQLSVDRQRIYLGESIVARVTLSDGGENPPVPVFRNHSPGTFDYRGPQSSVSQYMTFVNGRRQTVVDSSTVFTFVVTPSQAGTFETGSPFCSVRGATLSAPSTAIEVIAPQELDFAEATLSCPEKSVIVDSRFTIRADIFLRAIPGTDGVEPIFPQRPPAIAAAFLDFPETEGLRSPVPQDVLNPIVAQNSSLPFFSINNYQNSVFPSIDPLDVFSSFGSSFRQTPVRFRPNPERIERDGTNWWHYSFSVEYLALAEGTYSFGPLSVKGQIATGIAEDEGSSRHTVEMSEIYVIAPAVTVRVSPPPEEGRPPWFSGGVGRSMSAKATLDTLKCKVGDPLTLTLDITGDVNADGIRPPSIGSQHGMPDTFRFYGDHVESETIAGGKRFRYRLRPLKPGTLELPPILTAYYDSANGGYVTVATDPIPLQVDATTQIAVSATDGSSADSPESALPDGIVFSPADDLSLPSPPFPPSIDATRLLAIWPRWALLPPGLFLLLVSMKRIAAAVRRRREATRHRRAASRAFRAFVRAASAKSRDPASLEAASAAAREFAAATIETTPAALDPSGLRAALSARGIPDGAAARFASLFSRLEELPFRLRATAADAAADAPQPAAVDALLRDCLAAMRGIAEEKPRGVQSGDDGTEYGGTPGDRPQPPRLPRHLLSSSAFLAAAVALLAASVLIPFSGATFSASALDRLPDAFEWERAQSAMESARSKEDFLAASRIYLSMAEHGAATGPLFHNLGVALLLGDEPRAAAMAFDHAFDWRGAAPELANGRAAAEFAISGARTLPASRFILFWHYLPSLPLRLAVAAVSWIAFWALLALAVLLARRGGAARRAFAAFAVAAAVSFSIAAASAAVSCSQISSRSFAIPTQTPEPADATPSSAP